MALWVPFVVLALSVLNSVNAATSSLQLGPLYSGMEVGGYVLEAKLSHRDAFGNLLPSHPDYKRSLDRSGALSLSSSSSSEEEEFTSFIDIDTLQKQVKLGEGAFGEVWRAKDSTTGEIVAIKFSLDGDLGSLFEECRTAKKFESVPHLVRCLADSSSGVHDRPFIVLSYAGSMSIADAVEAGVLRFHHLVTVVRDVLESVKALSSFQTGYIHHDIKPANIMLSFTPHGVKTTLIDLGAVISCTGPVSNPVFTDGYYPPEGLLPKAGFCYGYDVYSVGVTLEEVLEFVPEYTNSVKQASECPSFIHFAKTKLALRLSPEDAVNHRCLHPEQYLPVTQPETPADSDLSCGFNPHFLKFADTSDSSPLHKELSHSLQLFLSTTRTFVSELCGAVIGGPRSTQVQCDFSNCIRQAEDAAHSLRQYLDLATSFQELETSPAFTELSQLYRSTDASSWDLYFRKTHQQIDVKGVLGKVLAGVKSLGTVKSAMEMAFVALGNIKDDINGMVSPTMHAHYSPNMPLQTEFDKARSTVSEIYKQLNNLSANVKASQIYSTFSAFKKTITTLKRNLNGLSSSVPFITPFRGVGPFRQRIMAQIGWASEPEKYDKDKMNEHHKRLSKALETLKAEFMSKFATQGLIKVGRKASNKDADVIMEKTKAVKSHCSSNAADETSLMRVLQWENVLPLRESMCFTTPLFSRLYHSISSPTEQRALYESEWLTAPTDFDFV